MPDEEWRNVAPGIIVSASEYEARYGHLDLTDLQRRMTPAVFNAFVRTIGSIASSSNFDVNELLGRR